MMVSREKVLMWEYYLFCVGDSVQSLFWQATNDTNIESDCRIKYNIGVLTLTSTSFNLLHGNS